MNFPGNRLNIIILTVVTTFWYGATEEINIATNTSNSGKHHHHNDYPYSYDDYQDTDYPSTDDYGNNRGRSLMDHDNEDYPDSNDEEYFLKQLESTIPGVPGVDYPLYQSLPETSFSCENQRNPGFYGDVEAQCQVFHICQEDNRQNSFLCPLGTVFNQMNFVCDWWFNFKCSDTPKFYHLNSQMSEMSGTTPASIQMRKAMKNMRRFRKASKNMAEMMKIVDDLQNSGMDKRHQQGMAEKMMRAIMRKRVKNLFEPRKRSEKIWKRTKQIQNDESEENTKIPSTVTSLSLNVNELEHKATTSMHDYLKLEPIHDSNSTDSLTIIPDPEKAAFKQDKDQVVTNVSSTSRQYLNPTTNNVESSGEYFTDITDIDVSTQALAPNKPRLHFDNMNSIATVELETPTSFSDVTPVSVISPKVTSDSFYHDKHSSLFATFTPNNPVMSSKSESIEKHSEMNNRTLLDYEMHNNVNKTNTKTDTTEEIPKPKVVFSYNSTSNNEPLLSIVNDTHISVSVTIRATAGLSRLKWKRIPDSRKMRKYFEVPLKNEDNLTTMDLNFRKRNMKPKSRIMWIPVKNNSLKMKNYWGMYIRPREERTEEATKAVTPTEKIEMLSLLRAEFLKSENNMNNATDVMSLETSSPLHDIEYESVSDDAKIETSSAALETSESSIKNATEYIIYNVNFISERPTQDITSIKHDESSTETTEPKDSCKSGCSIIFKRLNPKQVLTSTQPTDHLIENRALSRKSQTVFGRRSFLGASSSEQLAVKYDPGLDCDEDEDNNKKSFRGFSVIIDTGLVTKEKTVKRRKCRDYITSNKMPGSKKTMPWTYTRPSNKISKKNENKNSQNQQLRFDSKDQQYWLNLVKNWLDASPDSQRSHNARNTPDKQSGDLNHNSHSDTPEDWSKKLDATDGRNNRLYNSHEIHTRGRANKDQDDSFHSKWSSQNADNLPRNNRLHNEDTISKTPSRKKHHSDDLQIYQSNRNEWLIDVSGDNSDFKLPSFSNLMPNNNQSSFAFRTRQQKNKSRNENGVPVQNNGWLYDGGSRNTNVPPAGDSDWASIRTDSRQPSRDTSGFNQPKRFSFDSDESRNSFPRNNNNKRPSSPNKSQNWSPENGKEDRYWASSNQHFQTAENYMDRWQTEAQNSRNDWSRSRRDMNNWPNEENQDQNGKSNENSGAVRPPTYQLNEEILAALTASNFMDSGASWGDKNPQSSGPQNDEQVWLNDESDWAQEENMMKETWPALTGTMDDWSADTQSPQKPSDKQNRNQDWPTSSADKGSGSDIEQKKMTGENGRNSRANDWSLDMQRDISNDDSRISGKMSDFNWSSSSQNNRNKKGDSRNQSQWPQETIQGTPDWSSSFNDDKSKPPKQNVDKGRSGLPIPSSQPVSNKKGKSFNIPNQERWNIDSGLDMKSDMSSDWSQNNKRTTIKSSGKGWAEDSPTVGSSWIDEGGSRSGRKVDSNINLAWDSDESWDTDSKPRSGSDTLDSSAMNDWSFDGKAKSDWSSGNTPSFNNDGVRTGRQNPSSRHNNKGSSFPNSSNKGSKIPDRDWSTNMQKSEDDPWPNDGSPKRQIFPKGNNRPMKGSDTPRNKSPGRDWSTDTQKSEDDPWANDNPTRGQTSPKKSNRPMKGSGKPRNRSPDRDWSTDTQKSEDDSWQNDGPPKGQIFPKKNNGPMKGSDTPRNKSPGRDWSTDTQKTEDDSWANDGVTMGRASSMKSKQPIKGSATPRKSSDGDWSSDEDSDWSSDKSFGVSWSDQTPERRSWAQDKPKDLMSSSKGTPNMKGRTKNKPGNGNGKSPPSVPWSGVKGKNNATRTKGDSGKKDEEIVWSIQISSNGKPENGWVPITLRPNLKTRTNESSSPQNSKGSSWNGNGKTKKQTESWDTDNVLKVTQGPYPLNAGIVTENSFPSAEITEASQLQRFYISNARRRLRRDDKKGANDRHGIGRVREIPKSLEHEYEEMKDENNRFFLASADILVGEEYITKHGSKKHRLQNIRNRNNTPSKLKKDFLAINKENSSSDMTRFGNVIARNASKSLLDIMQESNVREIWSEPFDASRIPKSGWIPLLSASNFKVNATQIPYLNSNLNNSKFTSFSNDKSDKYEDNFEGNKETVSNDSSKEAGVASNSGRGARNFKNNTAADIYEEEETISFFDEEMRVGNETIRVIPFSNIMKQIRADSKVQSDDATLKAKNLNSGNSEWNLPMTTQPKTYSLKQIDASEMLTSNKSSVWMFAKQTEKIGDAWILVEEKKQPSETILQDFPDNSSITDDSSSTQHRNSKPDLRKQDYVYKIIVGNRTDERVNLRRMEEEKAEKINFHPKSNHTDKFSFNFRNGQQDSDWTPLLRSAGNISSRTNISSVNRRKIE